MIFLCQSPTISRTIWMMDIMIFHLGLSMFLYGFTTISITLYSIILGFAEIFFHFFRMAVIIPTNSFRTTSVRRTHSLSPPGLRSRISRPTAHVSITDSRATGNNSPNEHDPAACTSALCRWRRVSHGWQRVGAQSSTATTASSLLSSNLLASDWSAEHM